MSLAFEELYKPSGCLAFEVDLNYKQAIVNISRAERVTDFLLTDVNLGDCGEAVFKSCPETSSFCISKKYKERAREKKKKDNKFSNTFFLSL